MFQNNKKFPRIAELEKTKIHHLNFRSISKVLKIRQKKIAKFFNNINLSIPISFEKKWSIYSEKKTQVTSLI